MRSCLHFWNPPYEEVDIPVGNFYFPFGVPHWYRISVSLAEEGDFSRFREEIHSQKANRCVILRLFGWIKVLGAYGHFLAYFTIQDRGERSRAWRKIFLPPPPHKYKWNCKTPSVLYHLASTYPFTLVPFAQVIKLKYLLLQSFFSSFSILYGAAFGMFQNVSSSGRGHLLFLRSRMYEEGEKNSANNGFYNLYKCQKNIHLGKKKRRIHSRKNSVFELNSYPSNRFWKSHLFGHDYHNVLKGLPWWNQRRRKKWTKIYGIPLQSWLFPMIVIWI